MLEKMCSYNDFKQSSTMAMNSNASQFPHSGNWLGGSAYYSNPHSYYHPSPIQQHQMLSIMQENVHQNTADPNLISWPHHNYHHQHQNFDWMPPFAAGSQSQMSEYSADDSDISPSPASNRTISPSFVQRKSPYEWMKKTSSFHSEPSPGKTRTKDKYRVVYTDQQRVELEKEFLYNKYITIRRKTEMAAGLGLSERQVKIWFQNRRAKERKQAKKKQELQNRTTAENMPDRFDNLLKPEPIFSHL